MNKDSLINEEITSDRTDLNRTFKEIREALEKAIGFQYRIEGLLVKMRAHVCHRSNDIRFDHGIEVDANFGPARRIEYGPQPANRLLAGPRIQDTPCRVTRRCKEKFPNVILESDHGSFILRPALRKR